MAKRKRRQFTAEYKAEVVGLVRSSGKSVGQVARELDPTETAVRGWVRQARPPGAAHERGARGADAAATRAEDDDDGAGLPAKSCRLLRQERSMSFELVEAEKMNYPKALMCRALGLSRSGHHSFTTRGPSRREREEQQLDVLVAAIFAELKGRYGAPRIEQELRRRGHRTSKKRVAASMARQGLVSRPRRRWKQTTDSTHGEPVAPNLLARDFQTEAPDHVWVGDTTYLPVLGGFLYLVVILDLFSRKVVGWSLGDRLDADLSSEALQRAIARRKPGPGSIFHSDRGSEFAAKEFRKVLAQVGARQSMSRKGDCWDNAVAESFFSTLEFEGPATATWRSVEDAAPEMFTFIESYYNARRLHSHNGYRSPNETESDWRLKAPTA